MNNENKKTCDWVLVVVILVLLFIGFIMVYSSSYPDGYYKFKGQPLFFVKKQIIAAIIGLVAMVFFSLLNYKIYRKFTKLILIVCVLSSLATMALGVVAGGAQRWVNTGLGFVLQPSEIIKIGAVLYMADFFDKRRKNIEKIGRGFLMSIVYIGVFCVLIVIQDDLSTAIILGLTLFVMFFCSGAKITHLIMTAIAGIVGCVALIAAQPYRLTRIIAFMDPFKYIKKEGWQAIQSLYALGTGGLFGMGIGKSRQKFFYLPEPYNDFIFSIIGEELGFIGCVVIILLFVIFAWRGIRVAMNSKDFYGGMVALGFTTLVMVQFIMHIAVTTSSMPTTGRALPFISAGGSSLLFLLLSMGILLNISKFSDTYRS